MGDAAASSGGEELDSEDAITDSMGAHQVEGANAVVQQLDELELVCVGVSGGWQGDLDCNGQYPVPRVLWNGGYYGTRGISR